MATPTVEKVALESLEQASRQHMEVKKDLIQDTLESAPGQEQLSEVVEKLQQDNQEIALEKEQVLMGGNSNGHTTEHATSSEAAGTILEVCSKEDVYPSTAELVAKARAPVKREFLAHAPVRVFVSGSTDRNTEIQDGGKEEAQGVETSSKFKISTEKKSKRQQKKERSQVQARNSAKHVCHAVARTGDVNACPFGALCRFNHDMTSFLAQKPPDLFGKCPSVMAGKPCLFGMTCRFAGTHAGSGGQGGDEVTVQSMQSCEFNILSKDLQWKLWKRLVSFPKTDAQLQILGIQNKVKHKCPPKLLGESPHVKPKELKSLNGLEETSGEVLIMDAVENDGTGVMVDNTETVTNVSMEQEVLYKEAIPPLKKARAVLAEECCDKEISVTIGKKPDTEENTVASCMVIEAVHADDPHSEGEASSSGNDKECKLTNREKKIVDFRGKIYLAPLTTVGNLPFRRVCKRLGADITCGEMAMCTNLLQGQASEWALLRRHADEDLFGVQICGAYPDTVARTAELIEEECQVSFVDINVGCPIDIVVNKGAGSCLLTRPARLEQIIKATSAMLITPLTFKVRTGYFEGRNCIHTLVADAHKWGASAISIHGRTRQQRYSKLADWDYIYHCASTAGNGLQVIGNGDIFAYTDWNEHLNASKLSTCMIARGALIKPWLFTEIKEQRHWDITSGERLDILKDYARFGLEHWGSDSKGVETTRHFLLEWLNYMHRYIPVGLLEVIPQRLNWRPPNYFGRNDLETLMASDSAADWVRISEMLLGPAPANFVFTPRHKSNAYDKAENG